MLYILVLQCDGILARVQKCCNFFFVALCDEFRCTVVDIDHPWPASNCGDGEPMTSCLVQNLDKLARFNIHGQGTCEVDILQA